MSKEQRPYGEAVSFEENVKILEVDHRTSRLVEKAFDASDKTIAKLKGDLQAALEGMLLVNDQLEKQKAETQKYFSELQEANQTIAHYKTLCSQKNFPIQGDYGPKRTERTIIPQWLAEEAYEHYAKMFGNQQSLERLAERGGFGRAELLMLLRRDIS